LTIVRKDAHHSRRRLNEDRLRCKWLDEKELTPVDCQRDVEVFDVSTKSSSPLRDRLTQTRYADVFAYLLTLRAP